MPNPTGRLARWCLELQHYEFEVVYRKGALNHVADALSRTYEGQEEITPEIHPVAAQTAEVECPWYKKMCKKVQDDPEAYDSYKIENGKLFRCFPNTDNAITEGFHSTWKLCVPTPQRRAVLQECHDEPSAGHMGIRKTISRISQNYYWPRMYREVIKYVKACPTCQEYKVSQQPPLGKMFWSRVHGPWETVSTDLIGPLTRSSQGNNYLVVFQDRFTKWIEVHPLRKATAKTVIHALKEKIIYRFGTPKTIVSDNGSQYANKLFQDMTKEFGIKHQFSPPYTPQNNPVERANKVIGTMIAQLSREDQKKWDQCLPEVTFALNSVKHDSTGFSPALLNFGRELLPPQALRMQADPTEEIEDERSPNDYLQQIQKLKEIMVIAKDNLAKSFVKQRHHYNLRRRNYIPKVGDHVYKRERVLSDAGKGFMAKLAPKFAGPYIIKRVHSPVIVELVDPRKRRNLGRVHVKDIKPAHEADPPPNED